MAVRRLVLPLLVAALLGPALAGCLGASAGPVMLTAYLPLNDAQPGRGTEFAFHVASNSQFLQTLVVTSPGLPDGWRFESETETLEVPGRGQSSLIVRFTPPLDVAYGPHAVQVGVGDSSTSVIVNVKDLGKEPLRAGMGTQLHYIGWYDNGTLFGYSEPTVHTRAIPYWPAGGGDPDEARENATFDLLKVYVGGKRGVRPPEPYNGTGYVPVIPGFDARLRDAGKGSGMVAGETLAVRVPKELAYTIPGNEEHVLYGENLNFLIRIATVDILQPRTCDLPVCP